MSGDVSKPGVYEVPFGLTVGELINQMAGVKLVHIPYKNQAGRIVGGQPSACT